MDLNKIREINSKVNDKFTYLMTPNDDGSQRLSEAEFMELNDNFKGVIGLLSTYLEDTGKDIVFSSVDERDKVSKAVSSIIGDVYVNDFNNALVNNVKSNDFNDYVAGVLDIITTRYAGRGNNYFKGDSKSSVSLIVNDIFKQESSDLGSLLPDNMLVSARKFVSGIVKSAIKGADFDYNMVKPEFSDKITDTIKYLSLTKGKTSMGFKDKVNDYFYSNPETEKFSLDDLKSAVLNNGKPYSDKSWDTELKTLIDDTGFVVNPAYINKIDEIKPANDNLADKIDEVKPVIDTPVSDDLTANIEGVDKYAKMFNDYKTLAESINSKELKKDLIKAQFESKQRDLEKMKLYNTALEAEVIKNYERLSGLESFIEEMNTKVSELDKETNEVIEKTKKLEEEYKTSLKALKEAAKLNLFF